MQIHSPETASSVSSIFRSEPVLQSMLCFCWTSGIVYLLGAERLQPELLSELLSGPCDSSGLLDWGFLGSFLAHLLTSSCGFRFRDPTRRGICPVLLKLILSLFRTYSAYACLLTAHCSWVSHDPCTPTYEQSFLLIITHHYSSWRVCSLLYASLLEFMLKRCRRISITMCHNTCVFQCMQNYCLFRNYCWRHFCSASEQILHFSHVACVCRFWNGGKTQRNGAKSRWNGKKN